MTVRFPTCWTVYHLSHHDNGVRYVRKDDSDILNHADAMEFIAGLPSGLYQLDSPNGPQLHQILVTNNRESGRMSSVRLEGKSSNPSRGPRLAVIAAEGDSGQCWGSDREGDDGDGVRTRFAHYGLLQGGLDDQHRVQQSILKFRRSSGVATHACG